MKCRQLKKSLYRNCSEWFREQYDMKSAVGSIAKIRFQTNLKKIYREIGKVVIEVHLFHHLLKKCKNAERIFGATKRNVILK